MENVEQEEMDTLIQSIRGGQAVLWLGAGFSKMFGYPLWSELSPGKDKIKKDKIKKDKIKKDKIEKAIQLSKTVINANNIDGLFERGKNVLDFLSLNWKCIVTTNYDLTLLSLIQAIMYRKDFKKCNEENKFKPLYPITYESVVDLTSRDMFGSIYPKICVLIYLHGTILNPLTVIDTKSEEINKKTENTLNKIYELLINQHNQTCLFVGTSLKECEPHVKYLKKLKTSGVNTTLYYLANPISKNMHLEDLTIFRIPVSKSYNGYGVYENFYKTVFSSCKKGETKSLAGYTVKGTDWNAVADRTHSDEIRFRRVENASDVDECKFYSMFELANAFLNPMAPLNKMVFIVEYDSVSKLLHDELEKYTANLLCKEDIKKNLIYCCSEDFGKSGEFKEDDKKTYALYLPRSLHWINSGNGLKDLLTIVKGNILISGKAIASDIDQFVKNCSESEGLCILRLRADFTTHCLEVQKNTETLREQHGEGIEKLSNDRKGQKMFYASLNNSGEVFDIKAYFKKPEELLPKDKKTLFSIALYDSIINSPEIIGNQQDENISIEKFSSTVYEWAIASLLYSDCYRYSQSTDNTPEDEEILKIYNKVPRSLQKAFLFCLERVLYVLMDQHDNAKSEHFLRNLQKIVNVNKSMDIYSTVIYEKILTLYYDTSFQLRLQDHSHKEEAEKLYLQWLQYLPKNTTPENNALKMNVQKKLFYRSFSKKLQKHILHVLKEDNHFLHKYLFFHLSYTAPISINEDIKERIKELRNIYNNNNDQDSNCTSEYLDLLINEWQLDT